MLVLCNFLKILMVSDKMIHRAFRTNATGPWLEQFFLLRPKEMHAINGDGSHSCSCATSCMGTPHARVASPTTVGLVSAVKYCYHSILAGSAFILSIYDIWSGEWLIYFFSSNHKLIRFSYLLFVECALVECSSWLNDSFSFRRVLTWSPNCFIVVYSMKK